MNKIDTNHNQQPNLPNRRLWYIPRSFSRENNFFFKKKWVCFSIALLRLFKGLFGSSIIARSAIEDPLLLTVARELGNFPDYALSWLSSFRYRQCCGNCIFEVWVSSVPTPSLKCKLIVQDISFSFFCVNKLLYKKSSDLMPGNTISFPFSPFLLVCLVVLINFR